MPCKFLAGSLTLLPLTNRSGRMGMGEDDFLVPRRAALGDAGSSDKRRQQQPGVRKLLQPLAMALGIFGVSAGAARYLFPRKKLQPQQQVLQTAGPLLDAADIPTISATSECATSTETVMDGADLTSYFSLEPGAEPVFGVAEHESLYNGYRFWFASEENKAQFEVGVRRGHIRKLVFLASYLQCSRYLGGEAEDAGRRCRPVALYL